VIRDRNGQIVNANADWEINPKSKGIRWVFVWLAPDPKQPGQKLSVHPSLKPLPQPQVILDIVPDDFKPPALALREGQALLVADQTNKGHNVDVSGHHLKNPPVNILLPAAGKRLFAELRADRFPILVRDFIHPWMKAYIRVFDHPYFVLTDEDGKFQIKNAPAGSWRLVIWHPAAGWRGGKEGRFGEPVTIRPGGTVDLGARFYAKE
jgi:hypothetical protein